MQLCMECQVLEDHIFHPKHGSGSRTVVLHASYAELLACAESLCGLCMFFLRECWYDFRLWEKDSFRDITEATEGNIAVRLYLRSTLVHYIRLGHKETPIWCSNSEPGSNWRTWDFCDTRSQPAIKVVFAKV
jgi:hypothetical protein